MSKYDNDLDYAVPGIEISREELNAIIAEADRIITENSESNEKLAIAYLKKAQCLQKLEEIEENTRTQIGEPKDIAGIQGQIKNLIEKALELHPDMPEAIMQMGKIYHKLSRSEETNKPENLEKAIEMFSKAIQIKPDYSAAYNNSGIVYSDKNEYDLAIRDYSTAIINNPNCTLARNNRDDADAERAGLVTIDLKKARAQEPENEFVKALCHIQDDIIPTIKHLEDDEPMLKCFFCGLPFDLTDSLTDFDDGKSICPKCGNNSEIMEKIKLNNETHYHEIIENSLGDIDYNKIYVGYTRWLTKLTIEELRIRASEYVKPRPPEPIIVNNIPIHKNQNTELLEGETFKKHPKKDVEVSNLGRVKHGDCILEQYDPQNNGYLFVDIKNTGKTISEKVYRLVVETWLESPDLKELPEVKKSECHNTVHHISNNGYDNRIENLMWVTQWQHAMIHPWISIDTFDFEELTLLFGSYRYINITPYDYQRIINITKRMKQLDKSESPETDYFNYENIIEAMEDLIKKNGEGKRDSS